MSRVLPVEIANQETWPFEIRVRNLNGLWSVKGKKMSDKEREGLFYVCSLIEYVGRKTKNRRGDVVRAMSDETIRQNRSAVEITAR